MRFMFTNFYEYKIVVFFYNLNLQHLFVNLFVKPLTAWLSDRIVEIVGVEPTTPCLQSRCSSQLSYTPGVLKNFGTR